ncbi:MAG TPA: protein kinase [Ktedonobacterales bacterium]|nr:protein kinase [Ktedonobacterales bacterium]
MSDMAWSVVPPDGGDVSSPSADNWATLPAGGAVLRGRFVVGARVSAEPPGETFDAEDTRTAQPAMLRLLSTRGPVPDIVLTLMRQNIRRGAGSPHPYIVRTFDIERHGDDLLIASEAHGASLRRMLSAGTLAADEALTLARHIAAALLFLHGHEVVYGILMPATVEVTAAQAARLSDCGLSQVVDYLRDPYPPDVAERAGYLAPEEHRGQPITPATDVFHFGALLWEMITGTPPPTRDPLATLATKGEISHTLRDLLAQCMQPLPEQRLTDMQQISNILRTAQREARGQAPSGALARAQLVRTPTEQLKETQLRLPVITTEVEVPPFPVAPAGPLHLHDQSYAEDDTLRFLPPTVRRPELSPDARQAAEALLEPNTAKRPATHPIAEQPTHKLQALKEMLRKRSLALGAIVALVALAAVAYGTGVYLSSAASRPKDDLALNQHTTTLAGSKTPYRITHTLVLGPSQSLHIAPGATLAFAPGTGIILQGGSLDAEGTTAAPVIFTSSNDESLAGWSGASGNGAQPGAWNGIMAQPGVNGAAGQLVLKNVTIRFAGIARGAAVTCQAGTLSMTNVLQEDSAGAGLAAVTGCSGTVALSTFERDVAETINAGTSAVHFSNDVVDGSSLNLP